MKILTIIFLLLSFSVFGDAYKHEAPDGRVYYTDTPQKNIKHKKVLKTKSGPYLHKENIKEDPYSIGKTDKEKTKKQAKITGILFSLLADFEKAATRHDRLNRLGFSATSAGITASLIADEIRRAKKAYILNGGSAEDVDSLINQTDLPISLK